MTKGGLFMPLFVLTSLIFGFVMSVMPFGSVLTKSDMTNGLILKNSWKEKTFLGLGTN